MYPENLFLTARAPLISSKSTSAWTRMSKTDTEEMIEIEIDEREKQACLEEG